VTILKVIHEGLGLKSGIVVDFIEEDGRIIVTNIASGDSVTA
jgi:hypothetical protein